MGLVEIFAASMMGGWLSAEPGLAQPLRRQSLTYRFAVRTKQLGTEHGSSQKTGQATHIHFRVNFSDKTIKIQTLWNEA